MCGKLLFGMSWGNAPWLLLPVIVCTSMAATALGLLVATILLFPAWVRGRIELKRKTKALQEAEADLERLRQPMERSDPKAGRLGARDDVEEFADE